ncbi:MAG: glycosyl hydrolase family 95 catalytic domain-containing protein [Acutalibacteraceae bacterium]
MNKLWYKKEAKYWKEALPLGNGLMGVMIYGSAQKEKLCFNDGTLWSGYPKNYDSEKSLQNLDKVRQLIFEGKNDEADKLCQENLCGFYSESFMPLGKATLRFNCTVKSGFTRSLDLKTGIHKVETDGFNSEAFCSFPDKVFVYKVKSKKKFSVKISLKSKLKSAVDVDDGINLTGNAPDYAAPNYLRGELNPIKYNEGKGMAFCLRAEVETDGKIVYGKDNIAIKNATEAVLYFVTATGFQGYDKMPQTERRLQKEKCITSIKNLKKDYTYLKQRHLDDFSALYGQSSVSFDTKSHKPTDELLKEVKKGGNDAPLCELFYNYGKYLTVSSSRQGGQAANLQGIWNNDIRPPWSSNYTVNINTEMNYWGASRSGLSQCVIPLIDMLCEALECGRKTAEINYGCEGFACNHNVDIWRKTPPVQGDPSYMFAPLCGVWLANEVYSHYKNGFLSEYEDKVRDIITEAARFCNDFLVLYDGKYVVCPSVSPENSFELNGKVCKLDYASAFDMALVKQCFKNALEFITDEKLLEQIKEKTPLLYPFTKGEYGINEWHKCYEFHEKGHRHFSPLYAFYPGNLIGFYNDSEKTGWIKELYNYRLKHSTQHIGWSAAWAICLSARLRDGEKAAEVICGLLRNAVFKNLFCSHPPHYFQIDGNFGFVAGLNEMLLNEEDGIIELISALTKAIAKGGNVKNLVVNSAKVSFKWSDGKITEISADKPIKVRTINLSENAVISDNVKII